MKSWIILLSILLSQFSTAQEWVDLHQLDSLQKQQPKKVMILLHTKHCGLCKLMIQELNSSSQHIQTLKTKNYVSLLDAEYLKPIEFNQKIYKYIPNSQTSGIHELAWVLGNIDNQIVFPTLIFLNENLEKIKIIQGYINFTDPKISIP